MGADSLKMCDIEIVKGLMKIGFPMDMKENEDGVYEAYCSIKRARNILQEAFDIIIHTEHKRNIIGKKSWRYVITDIEGEEMFASEFIFDNEDEALKVPMMVLINKFSEE